MAQRFLIPEHLTPSNSIVDNINDFLETFTPYECKCGTSLVLYFDMKSAAYYLICHLDSATLASSCDLQATLDVDDEDEIYKLNREITEDQIAFKTMESDALNGRSFEDMVVEYDKSYREKKPLKVYGGQHRIRAITKSAEQQNSIYHGVRVYFKLSREQKVEIATVNNTSIAVPNDLLDRMREQLMGTELRDWCQQVGLLNQGEDFSDRRSPDVPTVRIARTLLVNYYKGLDAQSDDFHQPIVCKSGGIDEDYLITRSKIDWKDKKLFEMGEQFARLHKTQRDTVTGRKENKNAEFARKALSLTVVASWAYAAGYFQRDSESLQYHYTLTDSVSPPADPLNAKALSEARLKGTDPDTYRGLGARTNNNELGRMFEVFLVQASKASKKKITKELANTAIQTYEAKRATFEANKRLERI